MSEDRLRRMLEAMQPDVDDAHVWESLQPRMRSALRRHFAVRGAVAVLVVAVFAAGAVGVLKLRAEPPVVATTSTSTPEPTTVPTTSTMAPTSTTSTMASTTSAPADSATTTSVVTGELGFRFGELEPGRYRTRSFLIPFAIDIGAGLSGIVEFPEHVAVGRDPLGDDLGPGFLQNISFLATRVDDRVEIVAEAIGADRIAVLDQGETTVAGRRAIRIDAETDGPWVLRSISFSDTEWVAASGAHLHRFYVVDVDGATLVIWIEAPPDVWPVFVAEAETSLASIEFGR